MKGVHINKIQYTYTMLLLILLINTLFINACVDKGKDKAQALEESAYTESFKVVKEDYKRELLKLSKNNDINNSEEFEDYKRFFSALGERIQDHRHWLDEWVEVDSDKYIDYKEELIYYGNSIEQVLGFIGVIGEVKRLSGEMEDSYNELVALQLEAHGKTSLEFNRQIERIVNSNESLILNLNEENYKEQNEDDFEPLITELRGVTLYNDTDKQAKGLLLKIYVDGKKLVGTSHIYDEIVGGYTEQQWLEEKLEECNNRK